MDEAEKFKGRRDDAKWYIMMGVAMLFAGSISSYIAGGGALMCLWGLGTYGYWSYRMKGAYDPWKDPELEAWEDEQYHEEP